MVKEIVVTGSHGFLGSHVVYLLKQRGYGVRTFDIDVNPVHDVRDAWAVNDVVKGAWGICHLAAEPYIPFCYDNPKLVWDTNTTGTLNVLMAVLRHNINRVVHWSTSEVYGTALQDKMAEDHPTYPHSTYAASKLAADRLCFSFYKEHKIPVIILRPFNSYGPNERHPYVIPTIIEQLSKGNKLRLGNLLTERDFTFATDSVRAALDLMECENAIGETFNIGTGEGLIIEDIAREIADIMNRDLEILIAGNRFRPYDVDRLVCDSTKLRNFIDWEPRVNFHDGLKGTIEWFKLNNSKWNYRRP